MAHSASERSGIVLCGEYMVSRQSGIDGQRGICAANAQCLFPPERWKTSDEARLKAVCEAIAVSITDITAGRFNDLNASGSLRGHLLILAEEVF